MISSFITEVKEGLARTNRYEVIIPFPNTDGGTGRVVGLFCDAVNLPGMNIATTPHRLYGETREMPYERMFDPLELSFYVDSNMEVKAAFERWIHLIVNQRTRTLEYYNNYVKPIYIYVKKVDDSTPYVLTLHESYPKTIQSIQMSAESKEVMKVSVTLQYRYWTSTLTQNIGNVPNNVLTYQDPLGTNTGSGFPEPGLRWAEEILLV